MITIKNLHKSFGDFKVLNGINLTLKDNEVLSIIGKSGTGKSVLLKNLIGLITPDSGTITVDGINTTGFTEENYNKLIRPKVAFLFQEGALLDSMTVCENICLALRTKKDINEKDRREIAIESLKMVDLENIENVYPDELSGGMLKRAAIARAIAMKPKYLLYDEPTTGLDPQLSNLINDLIKRLNDELGITSLIITHDIQAAENISNRVAMLYEGMVKLVCDVKDFWKQEDIIFNNFIRGKAQ